MVKNVLGAKFQNKSNHQKHQILKWLSVQGDIEHATHKLTFKILNSQIPEEIATKMKMNTKTLRVGLHRKLDDKPRWLSVL